MCYMYMARRPGQVFSKGKLLELVWGFHHEVDTSAVTVLIRRLREKIEKNPSQPNWIHTVWGSDTGLNRTEINMQ